jgi:hypothetical protein
MALVVVVDDVVVVVVLLSIHRAIALMLPYYLFLFWSRNLGARYFRLVG